MRATSSPTLGADEPVSKIRRNKFCDCEPCGLLLKFMEQQLTMMSPSRLGLQILVLQRPTQKGGAVKKPARIVTLVYCPFCGTRIDENKEILAWIDRRLA